MKVQLQKIMHSNTKEKQRILSLLDMLAVYDPTGGIRNIIASELDAFTRRSKWVRRFHIVVARNDAGAIVGYTFFYPDERAVEIYVLPHLRQRGIGSAMIDGVRDEWTGMSCIAAHSGFGEYRKFFEKQFILCYDDYEHLPGYTRMQTVTNERRKLSIKYTDTTRRNIMRDVVQKMRDDRKEVA